MRKGVALLYACAAVLAGLALWAAWMGTLASPAPHAQSALAAESATTSPAVDAPQALSTTTPNTYRVLKVVDGDTLDVYKNGKTVRLRLLGMDTPEVVDPRKPVQCYGREASAEGHKLLDGQWVRLEYDKVSGTYGRYGRTLAYVFRASDDLFYNQFMVREGFAHEYDYNNQAYKYRSEFRAAQAAAKKAQLGFWSPATCNGDTTKPA